MRTFRSLAFALTLALALAPPAVHGQDASLPEARFRNLLEAQVLTSGLGVDAVATPSLRGTLQHRLSLDWSLLTSGMFLQDDLRRSAGAALGLVRTIPAGSLILEPFVEAGVSLVDARIATGSYAIRNPDGSTDVISRYRASKGTTAVLGGGVSWFFVTQGGTVVRPGLGYWQFIGSDDFTAGPIRLSVALGVGRPDDPWYELARDRTPPVLVAVGDRPAVGDSVEAQGGSVEIYASDANGIETLLVDREVIGLESASGMPAAVGLHDGAVMGRVQVSPPFGGQMLETVVRDRAGVVTRRDFTAFGPPDVQAPVVQETEAADDAFAFSAVVDDFSGIATASVDACPAPIRYLSSVQSEGRSERARAITGWGDFQGPAGLRVTDRSGNVARAQVPVFTPVVEARGEPPAFDAVSAIATGAGGEWVLVQGTAMDSAGGWLSAVTVDDQPVVLHPAPTPQTVHFKAWVGGSAGDRLTLTARTADGRVHSEALDVQSGDEPTPSGRLEVVLLGSAAERAEVARDRLRASEEIIGPARVSAYAAQNTIEAGLMDLGTRVRPDSRVWVHIEGVLGGAPNELAPRVEFADGSSLSVAGLTLRIRSLKAQAVLVTARILPGRSWQVPLGNVPGAQPAPGCFDPDGSVPGSVAALPGVPMERILEALTGAGDRDGDGRITVLEVLDWAGAGVPEGPVTFRPDAPLTTTGNKR